MSQKGIVGKEKVAAFQGFVAADKSRVEFKTLMLGCIVRFGDADELGVVVRVAKCPMNVGTDPKVRLVAVVTPVREAFLGLLPAISLPFLESPTSWQVVPFSKVSLVPAPASEEGEVEAADQEPALLDIWDSLRVITVGGTGCIQLEKESPLLEQIQKAAGEEVLSEVLVRNSMQPPKSKRPPRAVEGEGGGGHTK